MEDLNETTQSENHNPFIVHTNNGSILLSFRDMATGRTTEGRQTDRRLQAKSGP